MPSASAVIISRAPIDSFGADGVSGTTFAGGLVNQLDFNQANDKLFAVAKGATNNVAAKVHSFDAAGHGLSGGAFPLTVAAPGAEPDIAVDNTAGGSANNVYYSSESTMLLYGFTSAGAGLVGWPVSPATPRDICGIAVDPSGDIWATNFSGGSAAVNKGVHRYNAAGVFQSKVLTTNETGTTASGGPCHAAFDSNGDMYVNAFNGAAVGVWKYTAASGYTAATRIDPVATRALKVDRTNHQLYVVHAAKVSVYDAAGTLLYEFGGSVAGASYRGIAIDEGTDKLYLADSGNNATTAPGNNKIHVFSPAQAIGDAAALPAGATDVTESTATVNATVTDNNFFPTNWRLEVSRNGVDWTTVSAGQTAGSQVNAPISGAAGDLLPNTLYRFRAVTNKGSGSSDVISPEGTFLTDGVKPTIVSTSSDTVLDRSARLTAYVNPNSSPTSYRFEWGTTSGSYPNRVPTPNASLGAGPAPVLATETINGLDSSTTYYFRLIAVSSAQGTTVGPERTFTTRALPFPERGAELVSPRVKSPGGYVGNYTFAQMLYQVASDGESVFYPIAYGTPGATATGVLRYKAERGSDGWDSAQLTPPMTVTSQPDAAEEYAGIYQFFTPDLSCGVLNSAQPLTSDASPIPREYNGGNLFTRDVTGAFQLMSPLLPSNVTDPAIAALIASGDSTADYEVWGASPDCDRVVFDSEYRFSGLNNSGLYESDGGVMKDVAVRPDGSAPAGFMSDTSEVVHIGSGDDTTVGINWRAVSRDASRVYFSALSNDGSDSGKVALYLREDGETVKVSASETATANQYAYYQAAAVDGSKVAFLANYGLTSLSSTGPVASNCRPQPPRPCALYVYDVASGDLTDISADSNPADTNGATVAGVVEASEDLSRIYFAASGQLVAGKGSTYSQNVANHTSNLYLWDQGTLRFIATVRSSDLVDTSGVSETGILARNGIEWRSQTTPDGRSLLFSSTANIVGYDSGGVAQAYLYSLQSGETVCISCRRDGEPSVGDATTAPLRNHREDGVTARARSLSVDGRRAFFTSPDALTEGAVNGNANVYEWDDGVIRFLATGSPQTALGGTNLGPVFVGASDDGDDVFIRTPESLDPRDDDGLNDLYDIRVDGGFPFTPPAADCDPLADGCQGGGSAAETGSPSSQAFAGPGNAAQPSGGRAKSEKSCVSAQRSVKRTKSETSRLRRALAGLRRTQQGTGKRARLLKVRLRGSERSAVRAKRRLASCKGGGK